jgi:predicted DNA-binding transcriptional regulator AlpA
MTRSAEILGIDRSTLYSKTKPRRFANPLDRLAKT